MLNLLIADDHKVLRQALGEVLKNKYQILAEAGNGEEVMKILETRTPDVILMDITMPTLGGLETLEKLRLKPNCPPVIILSAKDGELTIKSALKAGAKGFVPKNASIEELEFAIDSVSKGQTYLSPAITAILMAAQTAGTSSPLGQLTKRELEILTHLANGKSNKEIGKLLHISSRTVDTHRSNIMKKLAVKTNAQLVKLAITSGLISV